VETLVSDRSRFRCPNPPQSSGLGYKAFLLGVAVSLRRKKIDLLEWPSFRWEHNVIRTQPTRFFYPKIPRPATPLIPLVVGLQSF
jgi:hypothetical protein